MRLLRRVPLRWRVTAAFTLAAAVVLAVLGLFLHQRLEHQLDASIDAALQQRLRDVSSLVRTSSSAADLESLGGGESTQDTGATEVTQVLSAAGAVIASEGADDAPLLAGIALQRALSARRVVVRREVRGPDRVALVAGTVGKRVVIVGTALHQRDEAVAQLDQLLLVGLPAALVLAALAGAWASRLALTPVDRIRRRAEVVGVGTFGERLPEPEADDELRRLARTLNTMLDRLEAGYLRERAFVDDAAHELRTPLTTLRGELELAMARPRTQTELERTVRSAQRQTERLVTLANDLLVLARSAHGELPLRPERLAARDLVEAAVARAHAQPRGDAVVAEPGASGVVMADRLRLEQALDNLILNALEHGAGRVTVSATGDEDRVTFAVADEGGPIDAELARRAFDRFTRGDTARAGTGTGLGLAIVKAIADAHEGQAGLGAGLDGATRAWIQLPRSS